MKYIKTFESWEDKLQKFHNKLDNISINDVDVELIEEYIDKEGYDDDISMSDEELVEHLSEHVENIKRLPDPMILYRIVSSETKKDIDINKVGQHYTLDEIFMDERFLNDIGIDDDLPMWVMQCEVKKSDIDINHTLATNIKYPNENEISIYKNSKVNIINIKKFD
jgi:hypothetical protein